MELSSFSTVMSVGSNWDTVCFICSITVSVSVSAGISFKLASHISLYAEPGIVYYFDDGSDISTIRKEKPFNINLQAGLRFNF